MGVRAPLRRLSRVLTSFGPGTAGEKAALLERLEGVRLPDARQVLALHEALCFLRAYPDDAEVLERVERMLASFDRRPDLRRRRKQLQDSGIAGTEIHFRFFAPAARRLARLWPDQVHLDWKRLGDAERLLSLLRFLALPAEQAAFDDPGLTARDWISRFKGRRTDAAFLLERWERLGGDRPLFDAIYDDLDPPLTLAPGPGTPSRTREKMPGFPVVYQTAPLVRARPDLARAVRRPPVSVRDVPAREAASLIELARDTMVPRQRDLECFAYASPADVRMVDAGGGLWFACLGVLPERRSLLEAVYSFLILRNGVAIGYSLCSALFRSSEIAFNVFESFRGGETAAIFGRLLATVRHLFGSEAFVIDPYQLGQGNPEGLASGAFWFYQKVGFRPREPRFRRLVIEERARMRSNPSYRSSPAALKRLVPGALHFPAAGPADVLGILRPTRVAEAVSRFVADTYGGDRERARLACEGEARARLGVKASDLRALTVSERRAWERWAPLVATIEGVERWTPDEKRAALAVIRAKGGAVESEFVRLFEGHRRLRAAVKRLAAPP